jgi:hypothetical protein
MSFFVFRHGIIGFQKDVVNFTEPVEPLPVTLQIQLSWLAAQIFWAF